jgi:hypothetical protein
MTFTTGPAPIGPAAGAAASRHTAVGASRRAFDDLLVGLQKAAAAPAQSNGLGPGRLVDCPGYDYPILAYGSGGAPAVGTGVPSVANRDVLPAGNPVPPGTPLDKVEVGALIVYPNTDIDHRGQPAGSTFVRLKAPVALKQPTSFTGWTDGDAFAAAVARSGGFNDGTPDAFIGRHLLATSPWAWEVTTVP